MHRYVVELVRQTRADPRLYLGASPRAGIALLRVAKARALADGREYVLPDDVQAVARARSRAPADPRSGGAGRAGRPRELVPRSGRAHGRSRLMLTARGQLVLALAAALPRRLGVRLARRSIRSPSGSRSPSCWRWLWVRILRQPITLRRSLGRRSIWRETTCPVGLEASPAPGAPVARGRRARPGGSASGASGSRGMEAALLARYAAPECPGPLPLRGRARGLRGSVRARSAPRPSSGRVDAARLSAARRARSALLARRAGRARREAGCSCAARAASTCTACASTSRASRCGRCTGGRRRSAGTLMVKELEDTPHDEVAVLLDADARARRGGGLDFDVQVRAAGSICACTRCGAGAAPDGDVRRRETGGSPRSTASGGSRARAARGRRADRAGTPLRRFLARDASPAAQAAELVVVTASLTPRLADALVERRSRGGPPRSCSSSRRASRTTPRPRPGLLRLQRGRASLAVAAAGRRSPGEARGLPERWPRMARTVLLAAGVAVIVAVNWARLEQPGPGSEAAAHGRSRPWGRPRPRPAASPGGRDRNGGRRLRRLRRPSALGFSLRRSRHRGLDLVPTWDGLSRASTT